jgi:hypothetical protein
VLADGTDDGGARSSGRAPQGQRIRLELDARAEREVTVLRSLAAIVLLIAGAWLFALPETVPRMFAAVGFVFAGLWLGRAARGRARNAEQHALELGPEALSLREPGQERSVPWSSVESVAIDEDRLVVIVACKDAPPLELLPQYRGVGLHALGDSVQTALLDARARRGCVPPEDG